ncbi:MAG: GDCCVxC domain-containing (seleno)protein [Pseudomonadota bacterium]
MSTLRCPDCGHRADETVPTNACPFFTECAGCGTVLIPLPDNGCTR